MDYLKINYMDVIKALIEQAKGSKYKPTIAYMNINGKVINILDSKNKKKVEKYLIQKELDLVMYGNYFEDNKHKRINQLDLKLK
jgi:hypothetical protein